MNILSKNNVLEQNLAHPNFPNVGLGDVAYVLRAFAGRQFVYTLIGADGSILLKNESKATVQNYVIEYSLELKAIH